MRRRSVDGGRDFKRRYSQVILDFKVEFFDAIAFGDVSAKLARYQRDFDLSHIPPLERRRLSRAAKCAFDLIKGFKKLEMPIVFSSYEGEMNRCFELQSTLAKNEPLSPTSFSLSVHNAISSLLSISMQNRYEISAISAYAPLEYALLAANLRLDEGFDKVLVLAYHEAISQEYFNEHSSSFMAAMIVSKQTSKDKRLSLRQMPKEGGSDENLLLRFLQNFSFEKKCSFKSSDENSTWQWDYEP